MAEEYEDLIQQARAVPGFLNFPRSKDSSAIVNYARNGYVVLINAHRSRCDTLAIRPECPDITHIPLPNFSIDKATKLRAQIENSLRCQNIRERGFRVATVDEKDKFPEVLHLLWVDIIKPILDALGLHLLPNELPHITWCTTGSLSFLPLHAAGHCKNPQEKIYNYAISSYVPTLRTIMRERTPHTAKGASILAVAQQATPGQSPLPGTLKELDSIHKHVLAPDRFTRLDGSSATVASVIEAMETHDWVHLACHAHQNISNPGQSGFFLQDGVLTVAEIARRHFRNKGLAFLSACQTATGELSLPDESVHLASGMLVAGYPSVIATMWSIMDDDAPMVAECVYKQVCGANGVDSKRSAAALHVAIGELRARVGESSFARWVPYIHLGG